MLEYEPECMTALRWNVRERLCEMGGKPKRVQME